jgi:hypothetical protein
MTAFGRYLWWLVQAPVTECARSKPMEFASVAELRAAGRGAVEAGTWANVMIGWHDHIDVTEDGAWQRRFMEEMCAWLCEVDTNRG